VRTPSNGVAVGTEITFDASTSSSEDGGYSDVIWDFGDGYQAEGPVVRHAYDHSGVFYVQLTVHGLEGGRSSAGEWLEVEGPDLWPDRTQLRPDQGSRWSVETTFAGRTCTMLLAVTLPDDQRNPERSVGARFPTIFQYSPYGGNWPAPDTEIFDLIRSGYAVVRSSPPGRYQSPDCEDAWDFFGPRDAQGGYDSVEWIAEQPWSDGHVGMHGASAPGIEALMTAAFDPPHLDAVVTNAAYGDPYRDFVYPGGLSTTNTFVDAWYHSNLVVPEAQANRFDRIPGIYRSMANATTHRIFDDYWRERSIVDYPSPSVAILAYTQNHDIWPRTWFELTRWVEPGGGRIVACPGGHGCVDTTGYTPSWGVDGFSNSQGEIRAWWDHHLKGIENGVGQRPLLTVLSTAGDDSTIATRNSGRWNSFEAYPPTEVTYEPFYLRSGVAPTMQSLSDAAPTTAERADLLIQSPTSGLASSGSSGFVYAPETFGLQRYEEAQAVVYETDEFAEPYHVVGPVTLKLYTQALSPDFGWAVRLSDVWPDGSSHFISEGYLKASHRKLDPERTWFDEAGRVIRPYHPHTEGSGEELMTPGEIYELEIEIWPVANRWLPGHRLRLQLSAQSLVWHPSLEPGPAALILHDDAHRSRLLLPVLPEGAAPHRFPFERAGTTASTE
jgi:putative CocE/NonD family hydrolase